MNYWQNGVYSGPTVAADPALLKAFGTYDPLRRQQQDLERQYLARNPNPWGVLDQSQVIPGATTGEKQQFLEQSQAAKQGWKTAYEQQKAALPPAPSGYHWQLDPSDPSQGWRLYQNNSWLGPMVAIGAPLALGALGGAFGGGALLGGAGGGSGAASSAGFGTAAMPGAVGAGAAAAPVLGGAAPSALGSAGGGAGVAGAPAAGAAGPAGAGGAGAAAGSLGGGMSVLQRLGIVGPDGKIDPLGLIMALGSAGSGIMSAVQQGKASGAYDQARQLALQAYTGRQPLGDQANAALARAMGTLGTGWQATTGPFGQALLDRLRAYGYAPAGPSPAPAAARPMAPDASTSVLAQLVRRAMG